MWLIDTHVIEIIIVLKFILVISNKYLYEEEKIRNGS